MLFPQPIEEGEGMRNDKLLLNNRWLKHMFFTIPSFFQRIVKND
jgi:hypothetical protein